MNRFHKFNLLLTDNSRSFSFRSIFAPNEDSNVNNKNLFKTVILGKVEVNKDDSHHIGSDCIDGPHHRRRH